MSKITGKVNYKEVLKGDTGYTYKPHVTTDGVLYWSNNGGLENPLPVNLKGEKGESNYPVLLCSQIGMISGDINASLDNTTKLISKINEGYKILIDDIYYIQSNDSLIKNNINIEGINEYSKLIVKKQKTNLFNITELCSSIKISKVNFENSSNDGFIVFNIFNVNNIINYIDISSCKFKNNMSLIRWYGLTNINPLDNEFGVNNFYFNNNIVENTRMSFIILTDIPFNNISIKNNDITNFDYTFFNCGISNEHSFSDIIQKLMKNLTVKNNNVKCAESWWCGQENTNQYICFILSESMKTEYTFNKVEGIKTKNINAVYDCYLSSIEVIYNYNVWKNNICFNVNKTNNTLMKAKGVNVGEGYRTFENNKFIVNKDFATKFEMDLELLNVEFMSCTSRMKEWVIRGNYFECYSINFMYGSVNIDNFIFEDNIIKSDIVDGNLINLRLEKDVDYSKYIVSIKNNIFNLNTNKDNKGFRLVFFTNNSNNKSKYKLVEINNNSFEGNSLNYYIYSVYSESLIITNDNFNLDVFNDNKLNGLIYTANVDKLFINNTILNNVNKGTILLRNVINKNARINITGDIHNIGNGYNLIELPKIFNQDITYSIKFDLVGKENSSLLMCNFKLYESEGIKKIKFDSDSKMVDTIIGDKSENYTKIKLKGENNNNFSLKLYNGEYLRFIMDSNDEYLRVNMDLITI